MRLSVRIVLLSKCSWEVAVLAWVGTSEPQFVAQSPACLMISRDYMSHILRIKTIFWYVLGIWKNTTPVCILYNYIYTYIYIYNYTIYIFVDTYYVYILCLDRDIYTYTHIYIYIGGLSLPICTSAHTNLYGPYAFIFFYFLTIVCLESPSTNHEVGKSN